MKDDGGVIVVACGNSTIRLAVVEDGAVSRRIALPHERMAADGSVAARLDAAIAALRDAPARDGGGIPRRAVLCSVVPELTPLVERACLGLELPLLRVRAAEVDWFRLHYDPPESLGEDRLCGLLALREKYGFPSVSVDFGTAMTVNVLDRNGDFAGGWIAPGIAASFAALAASTAQLPDEGGVHDRPGSADGRESRRDAGSGAEEPPLLGRTTRDCIRAGVLVQARLGLRGLREALRREFGSEPPVVATGGGARGHHADLLPGSLLDEDLVVLGAAIFLRRRAPRTASPAGKRGCSD